MDSRFSCKKPLQSSSSTRMSRPKQIVPSFSAEKPVPKCNPLTKRTSLPLTKTSTTNFFTPVLGTSSSSSSTSGIKKQPIQKSRSLSFPSLQHHNTRTLPSSLYSRSIVKHSKNQKSSLTNFGKQATIFEEKRSSNTKCVPLKVGSSKEFKHVLRELTC